MEFRVLGSLEVTRDGDRLALGGPRQRVVLARLLADVGRAVSVDALAETLWGDDVPGSPKATVQAYVSHLRAALGSERILGGSAGYTLVCERSEYDAHVFEDLVARARRLLPTVPSEAVEAFDAGVSLWRGSPFADLELGAARAEAERLEGLLSVAIEERVAARLSLGEHAEVVPELQGMVRTHPLREPLWMHLMTALYRCGRQAEALDAFGRCREALREELGIDPSPALQRLHRRILQQDPSLAVPGRPLRGYELIERIGEGAFGVVHRARHQELDREVAIKSIHPRLAHDVDFVRRFEAEARTVARLEHPHVMPLYDWWREPSGAFLVMRYVRGGTLRDAIDARRLGPDDAVRVVEQMAAALEHAHAAGVVHRDVKPSNVLLDEEGNAYLADFGIALEGSFGPTTPSGSRPSPYTSPEQLRGEPAVPASDVFALGRITAELLEASGSGIPTPSLEAALATTLSPSPARRRIAPSTLAQVVRSETSPGAAALGTATVASRHVPGRNPYKGLRAFVEADAGDFFGREDAVAALLERLGSGARLVAVVGPSGSGKSSVVRAGLVPAIRAGGIPGSAGWLVEELAPGERPIAGLAEVLGRLGWKADVDPMSALRSEPLPSVASPLLPAGVELVLVVDQMEEAFTLTEDEDERRRFLEHLVAAATDPASRVRLVLTMRADFLDRSLAHPRFGRLLAGATWPLPPMEGSDLERAIIGPADRAGVRCDGRLVAAVVGDVADRPGALPLLQFALTELFERSEGGRLTLAAYRAIGGVRGALVRRAEEVHGSLDPPARRTARQLFLRLVSVDGDRDARRLVPRAELVELERVPGEADRVLEAFGAARLLSFDRDPATRGPTVGVAHEAVLREWGRLRGWIDGAKRDLEMHRRLTAGAGEWERAGRDPSFLASGTRLEELEAWTTSTDLVLTTAERAFVDAGVALREGDLADAVAQRDRERFLHRRAVSRLRALVAILATAALVASGLTTFALSQRREAERQATVATARELVAASLASLEEDPERSILLALEGIRSSRRAGVEPLREVVEALHRAVRASRVSLRLPMADRVEFSPDGGRIAVVDPGGDVRFVDAATGRLEAELPSGSGPFSDIVFHPDGSLAATSGADGSVTLWSTSDRTAASRVDAGGGALHAVAFSPDGRRLAATSEDGMAKVWDLDGSRVVLRRTLRLAATGYALAFDPSGNRLAVAEDVQTEVWDLQRLRRAPLLLGGVDLAGRDVGFTLDGRSVLGTGIDEAIVWDARTGAEQQRLSGHTGIIESAAASPDGTTVATAAHDGTVRIWDLESGREVLTLSGLGAAVHDIAYDDTGDRIVAGGAGPAGLVWDVSPWGSREVLSIPLPGPTAYNVEATRDGSRLVAAGDWGAAVFDATSGRTIAELSGHQGPVFDARFSPDGRSVATAGADGTVRLWSASGLEVAVLHGHTAPAWAVAFTPDGRRLASASEDATVRIWDVGSRSEVSVLTGHEGPVWDVTFSPDGSRIATVGNDTTARVWNVDGPERARVFRGHDQNVTQVAFSPDGSRIATAGFDGTAKIWDLASGDETVTLSGHAGIVLDAEFSPDGTTVATASPDGTVRIWDAAAGHETLTLDGFGSLRLGWLPDGTRLAFGGGGSVLSVVTLDVAELVDLAGSRLTRSLTPDECLRYLHASC